MQHHIWVILFFSLIRACCTIWKKHLFGVAHKWRQQPVKLLPLSLKSSFWYKPSSHKKNHIQSYYWMMVYSTKENPTIFSKWWIFSETEGVSFYHPHVRMVSHYYDIGCVCNIDIICSHYIRWVFGNSMQGNTLSWNMTCEIWIFMWFSLSISLCGKISLCKKNNKGK